MKYILFSDIFNYSTQNFPTLFSFLEGQNVKYIFDDSSANELKKSWGNIYDTKFEFIYDKYESDFHNSLYKNINLIHVIENELFFIISNTPIFRQEYDNNLSIFDFAKQNYPDVLQKLLKIAQFWIDYWEEKTKDNNISAGCTFGGSTIFSQSFLQVLKRKSIPCYVLEHFFTGNDFYMELRYTSLPNMGYFTNTTSSHNHWLDKISSKQNKNVKEVVYRSFSKTDYILILGQVYNDFSILSNRNKYKNSILFYKNLIKNILTHTNEKIVFKAHPYENKKSLNDMKITYDELDTFRLSLPLDQQHRFTLVSNENMASLFENCKYSITLTSQAGLESLLHNKPIVTFNGAFYSGHGFSFDFNSINDYLKYIQENSIKFNPSHQKLYYQYMEKVFNSLIGFGEEFKIHKMLSSLFITHGTQSALSKVQSKKTAIQVKSLSKVTNPPKKTQTLGTRKRLLRKLRNNPKQFFFDSKYKFLRPLGKLFK